ncbi:hypothetical protein HG263_06935 [Pseudoalteromonas sp. JBTF-M23]|uniref:Uncharacterized protein n=1 Tax=Pseudoalteromonas caenipelagi TaxID=2726988 RepID=A0A849VAH2_9GAMM|nr:hypothetical protein [Pseudoalteromonas caenipelagi]NOU50276.1 hypothetical protein [Pseudoalteromonas caenipelagi]
MAYSIGTISIQQNNAIITGTNTLFERVAKAQVGDLLYVRANQQDMMLQVVEVQSDTQLKVALLDGQPFLPTFSANGLDYGLVQNFTATTTAKLAKGIADLQTKWHLRESQLTGWFASTDDSYSITNFLGEQTAIPTPTKIAELAQVAMNASSDLSTMAQAIEANKQSLATVEPRIVHFDKAYPLVISASNKVTTKHDEVVTAHSDVIAKSNAVATQAQQVSNAQQVVFELKADIKQTAQLVELDKTHSQAAAAICAAAQAQTQSDVQSVSADKTAVEQLKRDLLTLSDTLNNSMANAQQQIASQAQQTLAQATQAQAGIESATVDAKNAVARTANTFARQTASTEQSTQRHAFNAMSASNQALITHDKVMQASVDINHDLSHFAQLKDSVIDANAAVQISAQAVSLDALHSKANAALSALGASMLSEQNAKLNTALNGLLNNSLTSNQINELFPI